LWLLHNLLLFLCSKPDNSNAEQFQLIVFLPNPMANTAKNILPCIADKKELFHKALQNVNESIKDDEGNNIEIWYARELQQVLGYARWENFVVAIGRAMESCKTLGVNVDDHFREITKMIALAKGAQCEVQDFMLTRYAWCCQRREEHAKGHIETSKEMRNKSTRLCRKPMRVLTS